MKSTTKPLLEKVRTIAEFVIIELMFTALSIGILIAIASS